MERDDDDDDDGAMAFACYVGTRAKTKQALV